MTLLSGSESEGKCWAPAAISSQGPWQLLLHDSWSWEEAVASLLVVLLPGLRRLGTAGSKGSWAPWTSLFSVPNYVASQLLVSDDQPSRLASEILLEWLS